MSDSTQVPNQDPSLTPQGQLSAKDLKDIKAFILAGINADRIQEKIVSRKVPINGQALAFNTTSQRWEPQTISDIRGPKTATILIGPFSNADSNTYDYVTDGTDDDVQIRPALNSLPSSAERIVLREGTYNISA